MKLTAEKWRQYVWAVRQRLRMKAYNLGYRVAGAWDGYPLPPASLINLVIGTKEVAWYQLGGLFMQQSISSLLRRNGIALEDLRSICEFGCGCGRIIRGWGGLKDRCEIWGTDYNPALISWCQKSLSPIARFQVNNADPPLDFSESKFEFVYAYSVLTHLRKEIQKEWIEELVRILRPGGVLLLTTHGRRVAYRNGLSSDLMEKLDKEGILVFNEESSGSNTCGAYHSEHYMANLKGLGLELVESLPGGARDSSEQDMYLYRKIQ